MPEKLPIVHLPERLEPLGLTLTLNFEDVFDLQFVEGVSRAVGVLHILLEDLELFSGLVKYLQNRNRLYYVTIPIMGIKRRVSHPLISTKLSISIFGSIWKLEKEKRRKFGTYGKHIQKKRRGQLKKAIVCQP